MAGDEKPGKGKDLMTEEPLLRVENVSKSFTGSRVLDRVSFNADAGLVHALVGENGAGKTTLMNIIGGIHRPDEGAIFLNGKPVHFSDPLQAMKSGISIVHQELSLAPNLNVAQNIFVGREKVNGAGFINWKELYSQTEAIFRRIGIYVSPTSMVSTLSVSMQQIVEIAKALSFDAKVIIMDEPTSALSDPEVDLLFNIIRDLTSKGIAIVFISHKLDEVFSIADQISVLRDGRMIGTVDTDKTTRDEIIQMMVGRHIEDIFPPKSSGTGQELFSVEGLSRASYFKNISFSLKKGEILGFAGLVGSGRTEVARAIFAADKLDSGRIILEGREIRPNSPGEAIEQGICYLTEDRKNLGLFLKMSVRANIVAASLQRWMSRLGFLKHHEIRAESQRSIAYMQIRPPNDQIDVLSLSGGNQQKTLLAKWLAAQPKVLIADEPTRGVDVGAKAKLHADLRRMAEDGIGVILISSELPEILGLSDRIAVFREGQITAILEGPQATQEEVMKYATR